MKGYFILKEELKCIREKIDRLREDSKSIKATSLNSIKGNKRVDVMAELVAKINKLEQEYLLKYNNLICELIKIEDTLKMFDNQLERCIIQKRYIEGKSFDTIAEELHYSTRHIIRIYNKLIQRINTH